MVTSNLKPLPPPDKLWADYEREKSVHRVATLYDTSGETIRQRLIKAGYRLPNCAWSEEDEGILREWYAAHNTSGGFDLNSLAARLGRLKSNVSRKARILGLTNIKRSKVETRKPPKPRMFENDDDLRLARSARTKRYILEHGHPRGALGMRHTSESLAKMSAASRASWRDPLSPHNSEQARQRRSDLMVVRNRELKKESANPYSRAARGRRVDLDNRFFRSSWEANYARFLNFLKDRGEIKAWDYECKTFYFEQIKRGVRSYTPDFRVQLDDLQHQWHEVKGWMDAKSQTRLKRMAKYYPKEQVIVIDSAWFKQARRTGLPAIIPNWEMKAQRT